MPKKPENSVIHYSVSPETKAYLEDLARVGLYGRSVTEVARQLMLRHLEQLVIKDQVVSKRFASALPNEEGDDAVGLDSTRPAVKKRPATKRR